MKFNLVTIEIPAYITVANIEADDPVHAISIATNIVDQKILIDSAQREYSRDIDSGTILSVSSSDVASTAVVQILEEDGELTNLSYEVSSSFDIRQANIPSRIEVIEAARIAIESLRQAILLSKDTQVSEYIWEAYNSLMGADIDNSMFVAAEEDDNIEDLNATENIDIIQNPPTLHSRITDLCSNKGTNYRLEAPIFTSHSSDNKEENVSEPIGWKIDFGEILVFQDQQKIAAIGSWRQYANQDMPYFDSPDDYETAKNSILQAYGISQTFMEKPNLPDTLVVEFPIQE